MSAPVASATPSTVPSAVLPRLVDEGHTTAAWYGADILTAIGDVDAARAARRPAEGRHTIGEIALHHAYWLHEVRSRLTGGAVEAFPLEGEDWFAWPDDGARTRMSWDEVRALVAGEVTRLREALSGIAAATVASPLSAEARFDQVLGIAGHAAYHAGQVQLLKRLV